MDGPRPRRTNPGAGTTLHPPPRRSLARSSARRTAAAVVAVVALLTLPACGWKPPGVLAGRSADDDPSPTTAAQALSPRALVVSPLTSVRRSETAEDHLVLHLAIHDGFGQPVKALGALDVELVAPDNSTASWHVDLRDPEANASAFDGLVTRTYVLRLGGLPGGDAANTAGPGGWATVRAAFTVVDAGWGESRVLTAESRVGW